MKRRKRKLTVRILQRILAQGRGEVRAMEQAIQLEGVLRFVGLLALLVLLPAILLAWYGLSAMVDEDLGVQQELGLEATTASDRVSQSIGSSFATLERRVLERLQDEQSPIVGHAELDEDLVIVLRIGADGSLEKPFEWPREEPEPLVHGIFDPNWQDAWAAERLDEESASVSRMYQRASTKSGSEIMIGRALLDQARLLVKAQQIEDAVDVFEAVITEYPDVLDPWGYRLGDLARLHLGELLKQSDAEASSEIMESLMRSLLERRWKVGTGKDAAVARRGLKLMKSAELRAVREPNALDILVINERSRMHYWLGHLWSEFSLQLDRDLPSVSDGSMRWLTGAEAIWGFMDWKGERYVFALDKSSMVARISAQVEQGTLPGSRVMGQVLEPMDRDLVGVLTRRSLGPWLSDWTLVFLPRDRTILADTGGSRFQNNLTIVLLTLVLISLGVFLSAKQIKRELDMARMQTDFAANVSHELRSPITQIRLKGEMLMLGMFDDDIEREDAYQAIVRESERLSRLVDNVLDFGAIERGLKQYDLRPADLADTVHRAIDIVSSSQEVQDKVLDLDLPEVLPPVEHDPDAIAQCVINLVSNAAKYSGQGGWIGVRSRILEAAVEINISDKGIGIPAADLKNIFEPFYRSSDKTARLRKGTGIGLTITRYIMQAHGGEVSVQSRPGIGSTFTLRFPCQSGDTDPLYS